MKKILHCKLIGIIFYIVNINWHDKYSHVFRYPNLGRAFGLLKLYLITYKSRKSYKASIYVFSFDSVFYMLAV